MTGAAGCRESGERRAGAPVRRGEGTGRDTVRYLPVPGVHRPGVARNGAPLQTSPRRAYMLLRACIRSGVFDRDQQLIERDLVEMLGTSRNAVRLALQMLARDGLVSRGPKNGTKMVGGIVRLAIDQRLPTESEGTRQQGGFHAQVLEMGLVPATPYIRCRLQVHTDSVTMCEHLISSADGPLSVRVAYLPPGLAAGELELGWRQRSAAFERRFKVPYGHSEDTVEAIACEVRTAKLLGVAEGSPILLRETLSVGYDGIPRELAYNYNRGDRSSLFISTRDSATPEPPAT